MQRRRGGFHLLLGPLRLSVALPLLAAALACWLGAAGAASAAQAVRHQTPQNAFDAGFVRILALALEKAPGAYVLEQWGGRMERGRSLQEVIRGSNLDVLWAVTTRERERQMLPVRIPLDKGLSGWRLALIMQKDSARFAAVRQLGDLPVVTGNSSESLHAMLGAGRFDYFPRSLGEAVREADQFAARGIVAAPGFVLHMRSAVYFFVNKNNRALAAALEQGLRTAIHDGSFEQLFRELNESSIERARLDQRRVIELANPELPPETPLAEQHLWFTPGRPAREAANALRPLRQRHAPVQ